MKCRWHLCQNKLTGKQSKFCSIKCKSKYYVTKNRRNIKIRAVEYLGSKCKKCGYKKCIDALIFHHKYDNKEFGISSGGNIRSWESIKKELDKCDLLCCNCHSEEHFRLRNGLTA